MAAVTGTVTLLLAVASPWVVVGDKAIITEPSKPTVDPAANRPARPFEPLDPGTSAGGSAAPSEAPVPVAPTIPDARTQKELFERMDRQKNWLLDDPDRIGKSGSQSSSRWLPSLEETDYTTNPKRPQTVLERRLKSNNRETSTAASSDRNALESSSEARRDLLSGWNSFDSQPESTARRELNASSSWGFPSLLGNGAFGGQSPSSLFPAPFEARTLETSRPGRGPTHDPYARERQERYERVFSGEGFIERSGSLEDSAERLRMREQRTEAWTPALKNPAATPLSAVASPSEGEPLAASASRSGVLGPAPVTGSNPYLTQAKDPEPYESPAAKMLRTPPVQPPRFRP